MYPHLSDDQIEGLLQPTLDGMTELESTQAHLRESQDHLRSCEICKTRALEIERTTEKLASLRSELHRQPSLECPPEDIWESVAAGINSDSGGYLMHASSCDYCGHLLKLAGADLSMELTPEEELQIADLESSSPGWQMNLASRLQAMGSARPSLPSHRVLWRSLFLRPSIASQVAFGAALVCLVVLGFQNHRLSVRSAAQNQGSAEEIQRLRQDIYRQRSRIEELTREPIVPTAPAASASTRGVEEVRIVSLVLEPGRTRAMGKSKKLVIPHGVGFTRIVLHEDAISASVIHAEILTAGGQSVWSQELQPSESDIKAKALAVLVPAYLLTPNDYQVLLAHKSSRGLENFADFDFQVHR